MKRILLITENLGSGGAERQLTGLAVFLQKEGYDVQVITYLERQFYEHYLIKNSVKYALHPELLNRYTRIFYLVKILKLYRPDVVISFLPSVNISMCIVKIFYKYKLIVSERSYTMNFGYKNNFKYNLYRLANCVVPNSVSESLNIQQHYPFLESKIFVIPNFVDTDSFYPIENKNKCNIPIMLCVGRLIPSKNVLKLIEAIKIISDKGIEIKVKWVGKQYNKQYLVSVREYIIRNKLSEIFLLKDQTEDIVEEYQQADIFCLPTLFEGYPNVVCEAMSCGLPVVCSNVCEIPNIVKEGENGFLFDPANVDSIACAIEKCLSLPKYELIKIGENNRKKIIKENSKNSFVGKYISIIE